jgi:hypothetical protein
MPKICPEQSHDDLFYVWRLMFVEALHVCVTPPLLLCDCASLLRIHEQVMHQCLRSALSKAMMIFLCLASDVHGICFYPSVVLALVSLPPPPLFHA